MTVIINVYNSIDLKSRSKSIAYLNVSIILLPVQKNKRSDRCSHPRAKAEQVRVYPHRHDIFVPRTRPGTMCDNDNVISGRKTFDVSHPPPLRYGEIRSRFAESFHTPSVIRNSAPRARRCADFVFLWSRIHRQSIL